jgi:alpha-1,6-mannosyltransferase
LSGLKRLTKTLHLTNAYHAESGGIKTFYRALLDAANHLGHSMRLVVPSRKTEIEEIGEHCRIYHVAAPPSPFFDSRYRLLLPHRYLLGLKDEVQRIIVEEQPDLIEVCDKYCLNWLGGLIRKNRIKGLTRPVLVGFSCERMDDSVRAYFALGKIGRQLAKLYLSYCYLPMLDCHIANSIYTAEELYQSTVAKHKRQILIHPMGVDYEYFSEAQQKKEVREKLIHQAGADEQTRLLLYVGRLAQEKNLDLLVEMMKCLPAGYKLLIAGEGPLSSYLKQEMTMRAGERAHFLGHIGSRAALADLYANCDAFVHPNPREPFGITPLEAMAAGLPLIAPDRGGVLSYANETNAWLAEPSGEAFAAGVKAAFDDGQMREEKIANARSTACSLRWTNVTTALIGLYQQLYEQFREKPATEELFLPNPVQMIPN